LKEKSYNSLSRFSQRRRRRDRAADKPWGSEKFERCVEKVMQRSGVDEDAARAICAANMWREVGKGPWARRSERQPVRVGGARMTYAADPRDLLTHKLVDLGMSHQDASMLALDWGIGAPLDDATLISEYSVPREILPQVRRLLREFSSGKKSATVRVGSLVRTPEGRLGKVAKLLPGGRALVRLYRKYGEQKGSEVAPEIKEYLPPPEGKTEREDVGLEQYTTRAPEPKLALQEKMSVLWPTG